MLPVISGKSIRTTKKLVTKVGKNIDKADDVAKGAKKVAGNISNKKTAIHKTKSKKEVSKADDGRNNVKSNTEESKIKETKKGDGAEKADRGVKGGSKTGNIINNLDTNNIPNMTKQEILNEIPNNWKYTVHNGFVHIKDETGSMRIRIDPPDKVTSYPHVHVYDNDGNLLDRMGNIVDRKSADGHIPYKN